MGSVHRSPLVGGHGGYRNLRRLREDDLLVRQRAGGLVGQAASSLQRVLHAFRHRYLSPPSREHPLPDPHRLAQMRDLDRLVTELRDLAAAIQGLPFPDPDGVWSRLRSDDGLRDLLLRYDELLTVRSEELALFADRLTEEVVAEGKAGEGIRQRLSALRETLHQRAAELRVPV